MNPVPYADFAARALELYQAPIRRPATRKKLAQVLREFEPLCPDTAAITPGAIAAWIAAHPTRSPLTAFTLLRAFRTAVRIGIGLMLVPSDPFSFRSPRRWWPDGAMATPQRPRHHSADAIGLVLLRGDLEAREGRWRAARLRAVVYAVAYTGARAREILGLRAEDVDLEEMIVHIRPNARRPLKTAAAHARLPIPWRLAEILAWWLQEVEGCEWLFPGLRRTSPWLGGAPGYRPVDQVRQLGERAGVPGVTLLSLRHSFATIAESWGIGELMLQRLLRHSRPQTQLHYRHEDLAAMREATDKIHF